MTWGETVTRKLKFNGHLENRVAVSPSGPFELLSGQLANLKTSADSCLLIVKRLTSFLSRRRVGVDESRYLARIDRRGISLWILYCGLLPQSRGFDRVHGIADFRYDRQDHEKVDHECYSER